MKFRCRPIPSINSPNSFHLGSFHVLCERPLILQIKTFRHHLWESSPWPPQAQGAVHPVLPWDSHVSPRAQVSTGAIVSHARTHAVLRSPEPCPTPHLTPSGRTPCRHWSPAQIFLLDLSCPRARLLPAYRALRKYFYPGINSVSYCFFQRISTAQWVLNNPLLNK